MADGTNYTGSSPRGRGTQRSKACTWCTARFIPAWAGNTPAEMPVSLHEPVHPRVGGEHHFEYVVREGRRGSSPRGRGTLNTRQGQGVDLRFIPAWAGNTALQAARQSCWPVHPRVGGEHAKDSAPSVPSAGSSPRGRGTPWCQTWPWPRSRFIPAWAGNTVGGRLSRREPAVHPRVGGEHSGVVM